MSSRHLLSKRVVLSLLIFMEFCITIVVISNSIGIAVSRAASLALSSGVGYKDLVIVAPMNFNHTISRSDFLSAKNLILNNGLASGVSIASSIPFYGKGNVNDSVSVDVSRPGIVASTYYVDSSFFKVIGATLIAGRYFNSVDIGYDSSLSDVHACIISEALAHALYYNESPVGKWLYVRGRKLLVIGEVRHLAAAIYSGRKSTAMTITLPLIADESVSPNILSLSGSVNEKEIVGKLKAMLPSIDWSISRYVLIKKKYFKADSELVKGLVVASLAVAFASFCGLFALNYIWLRINIKRITIHRCMGGTRLQVTFEFIIDSMYRMGLGLLAGMTIVLILAQWTSSFEDLQLMVLSLSLSFLLSLSLGIAAIFIPLWSILRMAPSDLMRVADR